MSGVPSPLGERSPLLLSAAAWLKCQKDSKSLPGSAAGQRGKPRRGLVNVNVSPMHPSPDQERRLGISWRTSLG